MIHVNRVPDPGKLSVKLDIIFMFSFTCSFSLKSMNIDVRIYIAFERHLFIFSRYLFKMDNVELNLADVVDDDYYMAG